MAEVPQYQPLKSMTDIASSSLTEHLRLVHWIIASHHPAIDRVALAAYDAMTDSLSTFISSNKDGVQFKHHAAKLSNVPSLQQLAQTRQSRTVQDVNAAFSSSSQHTQWLKAHEYRSSFTVPVFHGDDLSGFLFFDSKTPMAVNAQTSEFLEVFAHLISQLYLLHRQVIHGVAGTVHVASDLARVRDLETGQHLERMAAYSRLMARGLARTQDISDEFIEYLYLFAPLHDIGKVGIPDHVLLKPGDLSTDEWDTMRRHVDIGIAVVDQMAKDLKLGNALAFRIMRNIVAAHHERGDGSGYPLGLRMADIPLEARIVAVADVYDALASKRPYKMPWSEAQIRQELVQEVERGRLDSDCVRELLDSEAERVQIAQEHVDP